MNFNIGCRAAAIEKAFGGLDILFVNAGIALLKPADAWDEASFDRVFGINASIAMAVWPQVTFSDISLAGIWGSILVCAVLAEWLFVSP